MFHYCRQRLRLLFLISYVSSTLQKKRHSRPLTIEGTQEYPLKHERLQLISNQLILVMVRSRAANKKHFHQLFFSLQKLRSFHESLVNLSLPFRATGGLILSSNSYHTPIMNFFRMKMFEICRELTTEFFRLAANVLMN